MKCQYLDVTLDCLLDCHVFYLIQLSRAMLYYVVLASFSGGNEIIEAL